MSSYSYVPSKSRSFEVLEQIASQYSNEDPIPKSRSSIGSSISYLYSRNVEPPALPYAKDAKAKYTYINTEQESSFYRHVGHQMNAEDQNSAENPSVSYEKSSESIRSLYTSAEERRLPGVSRSRTEEDLMALASKDYQEHIQERQSDSVRSHVSTSLSMLDRRTASNNRKSLRISRATSTIKDIQRGNTLSSWASTATRTGRPYGHPLTMPRHSRYS